MNSRTIFLMILLAVLLLSVSLRFVYCRQLNEGPGVWQHLWPESDMNYFDAWGKEIATGDLLSARIAAPMHGGRWVLPRPMHRSIWRGVIQTCR